MEYIFTFLVSVAADVTSRFICKWLDRYDENRKSLIKKESPWEFAAPWGLFHWGETNGVFTFLSLLYAIPCKSQAVRGKFTKNTFPL